MKKYWGKKDWSESLYLAEFYDDKGKIEKTEYCVGFPFNWDSYLGFKDKNTFEDTNEFITYSESFNIYQIGKIQRHQFLK